jgi:N-methylhydantoinase A
MGTVRIGIDIGGTFTDIVVLDEGTKAITIAKVSSRRDDPAGALLDAIDRGIERSGVSPDDVKFLVHGTTIVTNAILENKLPKTALLTTEGFRDVLEIGRHFRPDMYDMQQDKVVPIVPRNRIFGVSERTDAVGNILQKPESAQLERLVQQIGESDCEALAVCFLNSFINPENEETAVELIRERLQKLHISASYDVCREIREYERMSTVVLNAAAKPLVDKYLGKIEPLVRTRLPNANILLMQSSGGSLTIDAARSYPARIITSGPAGGALAVQRLSQAANNATYLGFDMGGTSTDISLIDSGQLHMTTEGSICQHPVLLPMIEINTIGAGAGSIAWLDEANGLHVGPQSAGSNPGPVAYNKGGTEPTVTDVNLILGRLDPDRFADAGLSLDLDAARAAVDKRIATPLGMSVEETSAGILRIANANMERAIRVSSAEKGYDPRDIAMVAFGGAGPMHAAALGREIGISTIIVPQQPGVFSAIGLVMSDIRHDFVQTSVLRGSDISEGKVEPLFKKLETLAVQALETDGVPQDQRVISRSADLRYVGQAFEVSVPLPEGQFRGDVISETLDRFHEKHLKQYAHKNPERDVEFVNGRVSAIGLMNAPPLSAGKNNAKALAPGMLRPVYVDEVKGFVDTPVYERSNIAIGTRIEGPAIIEQIDTTVVIHPGQTVETDNLGNLLISTGAS